MLKCNLDLRRWLLCVHGGSHSHAWDNPSSILKHQQVSDVHGIWGAQQYYLSTNLGGSKLKHCNTNGAAFPRILRVSVVCCLLTVGSEA